MSVVPLRQDMLIKSKSTLFSNRCWQMSTTPSEQPPRFYLLQHYWLRVLKKRLIQIHANMLNERTILHPQLFHLQACGPSWTRQCIDNLRSKLTDTQNERFYTLVSWAKYLGLEGIHRHWILWSVSIVNVFSYSKFSVRWKTASMRVKLL